MSVIKSAFIIIWKCNSIRNCRTSSLDAVRGCMEEAIHHGATEDYNNALECEFSCSRCICRHWWYIANEVYSFLRQVAGGTKWLEYWWSVQLTRPFAARISLMHHSLSRFSSYVRFCRRRLAALSTFDTNSWAVTSRVESWGSLWMQWR